MQDVKEIQTNMKSIRSVDLWREIIRRLGLKDARLEIAVHEGEPIPVITVHLPLDAMNTP
jgi:hypothetical protein